MGLNSVFEGLRVLKLSDLPHRISGAGLCLSQDPLSEHKHTFDVLRYATLTARRITFHF